MTTKVASLVVAGAPAEAWSVSTPGFISFNPATSEISIEGAPTFSETPDTLTARLGVFTFETAEDFDQRIEVTDETGFGWDSFTIVEGHNIISAPRIAPNAFTAWAVEWTASKTGRAPLVTYSNVEYVERFSLTSGEIAVTGGARPLVAEDTVSVDASSLTFRPAPNSTALTVTLVRPDGTEVAVPPAVPPSEATVSYVGAASSETASVTLPGGAQAADMMWAFVSGVGLDLTAASAAGWVEIAEARFVYGPNDRVSTILRKPVETGETVAGPFGNSNKTSVIVWRGVNPAQPVDAIAIARNEAASVTITYPALGGFAADRWVMRFRMVERQDITFPPAKALTDRTSITSATFHRQAIASTTGAVASVAEATETVEIATRGQVIAIAIRPEVA